jgi:hypothetical protein
LTQRFSAVLIVAAAFSAVPFSTAFGRGGTQVCDYVILAKGGISTVSNSVITGASGVTTHSATAITGFGDPGLGGTVFDRRTAHEPPSLCGELRWCHCDSVERVAVGLMRPYTNAAGRTNNDTADNLGGESSVAFSVAKTLN